MDGEWFPRLLPADYAASRRRNWKAAIIRASCPSSLFEVPAGSLGAPPLPLWARILNRGLEANIGLRPDEPQYSSACSPATYSRHILCRFPPCPGVTDLSGNATGKGQVAFARAKKRTSGLRFTR